MHDLAEELVAAGLADDVATARRAIQSAEAAYGSTPKPPDIEWTWTKDGRLIIEWEDR